MKKCRALVLGGGGARGALQVGACRALFEAGYKPDLIVGTSIGAANAAALGLWGMNLSAIEKIDEAYQEAADSQLMDPRIARLIIKIASGRLDNRGSRLLEQFLNLKGITPSLRFDQIPDVRIGLVGADLDTGEPVIYGESPEQSVMEGVLASTAIQPWFTPVVKNGHWIMDGGAMSNLPIEPAIVLGATEILAVDINDPSGRLGKSDLRSRYIDKLVSSVTRRETNLEMALAAERGVPVRLLHLTSTPSVPVWDFSQHKWLSQIGYETTRKEIQGWELQDRSVLERFSRQINTWFKKTNP